MYLFKSSIEIAENINLIPELKREFEEIVSDNCISFDVHHVSPSEEKRLDRMADYWHSPYRNPHTNGMWMMFLLNKGVVSTTR